MTGSAPKTDVGISGDSVVVTARLTWCGLAGYFALLAAGVGLFFLVRGVGESLNAPSAPADARAVGRPLPGQVDVVMHVTATLAAMIAIGLLLGGVLRRIGQPPVIGEMVAGILLGPSLLGAIAPETFHLLIGETSDSPQREIQLLLAHTVHLSAELSNYRHSGKSGKPLPVFLDLEPDDRFCRGQILPPHVEIGCRGSFQVVEIV